MYMADTAGAIWFDDGGGDFCFDYWSFCRTERYGIDGSIAGGSTVGG